MVHKVIITQHNMTHSQLSIVNTTIKISQCRMTVSDEEKHRHVDIATLVIPSDVAETGIEVGDGTDFVLEAPTRVIDQLVECAAESDRQQQPNIADAHPCVEGVFDLTVASHLIPDITEEQFVHLLHHADDKEKISSSPHAQQVEEKARLLQTESIHSGEIAFVSIAADPFVQTFQELHSVEELNKTVGDSGSFSASIRDSRHRKGDLHEAFLLNIPTHHHRITDNSKSHGAINTKEEKTDDRTDNDNKYVLALPEVVGVGGSSLLSSSTNNISTASRITEGRFAPLPTDVTHVELQVSTVIIPSKDRGTEELREIHLDLVVDRKVPLVGYVILVSGLFALSSIGAALDLQRGEVTSEMKIFWRLSSTSLLFLWPAMKSGVDMSGLSNFEMFVLLPFAAVNYAIMNTSFAVALEYTSLVNAFILSNLASLIIILSKLVVGIRIAALEGLGTLVGLSGAVICAMAPSESSSIGDEDDTIGSGVMIGNLLAFVSSITVAMYLVSAKNLRPKIDLFLFMFLIFSLASVFLLAYIIFSGQPCEFSSDEEVGIFGWISLRKDRLWLELYIAVICNGVGTTGYVAIMKYFDAVVVSMVMLMEPVIALFQGIAVGVATFPGLTTWLGNAVVVSGSVMVIWSGSKKTETVDATDALHQTDTELVKSLNCSLKIKGSRLMKSPLISRERGMTEDTEFVPVRGQSATRWSSIGPN